MGRDNSNRAKTTQRISNHFRDNPRSATDTLHAMRQAGQDVSANLIRLRHVSGHGYQWIADYCKQTLTDAIRATHDAQKIFAEIAELKTS